MEKSGVTYVELTNGELGITMRFYIEEGKACFKLDGFSGSLTRKGISGLIVNMFEVKAGKVTSTYAESTKFTYIMEFRKSKVTVLKTEKYIMAGTTRPPKLILGRETTTNYISKVGADSLSFGATNTVKVVKPGEEDKEASENFHGKMNF